MMLVRPNTPFEASVSELMLALKRQRTTPLQPATTLLPSVASSFLLWYFAFLGFVFGPCV